MQLIKIIDGFQLSVIAIFVVSILGKAVTDYGEGFQVNQLSPALTLNEVGKHMWDIPLSVTDSTQSFKVRKSHVSIRYALTLYE